jgi:D-alanyl-D-alanine carboxypeptidase
MEKFLIILSLLLPVSSAFAYDRFEDTAENLAPQVETNRSVPNTKSTQGTWTYAFELIAVDGSSKILSEQNRSVLVKPASTMKLFTSWFAFKNQFRDTTYLAKMLKESVNEMADATLKGMGGPKALKNWYAKQGLALTPTDFIQVDGSGLSYDNKADCAIEMKLLKLIYADPSYSEYKELLARPGEVGTLEKRLLDLQGVLFAKTGTLNRTAGLSGFVETKSGTMLFCILTDYLPSQSSGFRPKIDAMVLENVKKLEL